MAADGPSDKVANLQLLLLLLQVVTTRSEAAASKTEAPVVAGVPCSAPAVSRDVGAVASDVERCLSITRRLPVYCRFRQLRTHLPLLFYPYDFEQALDLLPPHFPCPVAGASAVPVWRRGAAAVVSEQEGASAELARAVLVRPE